MSSSPLYCGAEAIPSFTKLPPPPNFTTLLQTHLWTLIQTHLFDPQAARKLKPLQILTAGLDRASDEMLDDENLDLPPEPLDGPLLSDGEEMLYDDLNDEEDELLFSESEGDEDELLFSGDEDDAMGVGYGSGGDEDDELLDNPEVGSMEFMGVDDMESTEEKGMLDIYV